MEAYAQNGRSPGGRGWASPSKIGQAGLGKMTHSRWFQNDSVVWGPLRVKRIAIPRCLAKRKAERVFPNGSAALPKTETKKLYLNAEVKTWHEPVRATLPRKPEAKCAPPQGVLRLVGVAVLHGQWHQWPLCLAFYNTKRSLVPQGHLIMARTQKSVGRKTIWCQHTTHIAKKIHFLPRHFAPPIVQFFFLHWLALLVDPLGGGPWQSTSQIWISCRSNPHRGEVLRTLKQKPLDTTIIPHPWFLHFPHWFLSCLHKAKTWQNCYSNLQQTGKKSNQLMGAGFD